MRRMHSPRSQRQRAYRPGRRPQGLDDPGGADDIRDGVERAHLVELDLVHADTMHLSFGFGEHCENRLGARGDRGIQAHAGNCSADRRQPDMNMPARR